MKPTYVTAAAPIVLFMSAVSHAADEPTQHWYRCNTHTHTTAAFHSDADGTPQFVAQWYKAHGYQCLFITDHENLTDVAPLNAKYGSDGTFLVLPGQEITQRIADAAHPSDVHHFHINGLNIDRPIMPLGYPGPAQAIAPLDTYRRNIAAIQTAGGIPQVNHPNLLWSVRLEDLLPLTQLFLLEVWNAYPTSNNLGGVDDGGYVSPSAEGLWDALLTRGKVVWGVASDDTHEYQKPDDREAPTPGKGWIVLQAATLTAPAVTAALREGRFYASTGISLESYVVDGNGISLKMSPPHEWSPAVPPSARYVTRFIGANGALLAEVTGTAPRYSFKGNERYVRASIVDSDGRRAWTQPVFRDGRKTGQPP